MLNQTLVATRLGEINENAFPSQQLIEAPDSARREWLGLWELSFYANLCERTLRSWIHSPRDPLPAVKVRGKVLVRKSDFDRYLERHRIHPLVALDVERIVNDVLGERR
ncbi:MAG TPA: helix-turn-helix domain-containing protein [Terriglobia bacterium]|nr:helix-turn-helix domain-containing protein [Terriglobia bacterium]